MAGYKPGQSGNPGGRTKEQRDREKRLAAAIRGLGGEDCEIYAKRLHEIAMDKAIEAKDSIKAIEVLLTRCIGKPADIIIDDSAPELSAEEEQSIVAEIAREHIASLSPDEKLKLLASPAPSPTIQ